MNISKWIFNEKKWSALVEKEEYQKIIPRRQSLCRITKTYKGGLQPVESITELAKTLFDIIFHPALKNENTFCPNEI